MTIISLGLQIVQQIQFIGMLSQLNINWPVDWNRFTSFFNFFNLDVDYFYGKTDLPVIDFRMTFIVVSVCIPIVINLLMLLVFKPLYELLWYLTLSSGSVVLLAGFFGQVLPGNATAGVVDAKSFIIIGGSLTGAALLVLAIRIIRNKFFTEHQSIELTFEAEQQYKLRFHRFRTLFNLIVFLFFSVIGIILLRIFSLRVPGVDTSVLDQPLFKIIGFIAFGFAGLSLLLMIFSLFQCGRNVLAKVSDFFKDNLLMVMLILMNATFIPTIKYAVTQYLCAPYSCPAGYTFNPYAYREANDFDISPARFCDRCDFLSTCPLSVGGNQVCPGFTGSQIWRNPEVSCTAESNYYYIIAATIVLVSYFFGMPYVYFSVIRYVTDKIADDTDLGDEVQADKLEDDDLWFLKVNTVLPVVRGLYEPYRLPRRYYMLVSLLHRVCITICLTIVAAYSTAAAAFVLLIHGAACLFVIALRPFVEKVEQVVSSALAVANTLNGIYAVYVWQNGATTVPLWVTGVFLALNVVVPLLAAIVSVILRVIAKKKAAKEKKRLEQEALERRAAEAATAAEAAAVAAAAAAAAAEEGPAEQEMSERLPNQSAAAGEQASDPVTGVVASCEPFAEARTTHTATPPPQSASAAPAARAATPPPHTAARSATPQAARAGAVTPPPSGTRPPPPPPRASTEPTGDGALVVTASLADMTEEECERELARRAKLERKARRIRNHILTGALNERSIDIMNHRFMIMGLFFFAALGVSFLGYLRSPLPTQIRAYGSGSDRSMRLTALAGYSSWIDFTDNCCCMQQQTVSIRYNVSERWVCRNGNSVERGRVDKDGSNSGLALRGLCVRTFVKDCALSSIDGWPTAVCSTPVSGVTSKALQFNW